MYMLLLPIDALTDAVVTCPQSMGFLLSALIFPRNIVKGEASIQVFGSRQRGREGISRRGFPRTEQRQG